MGRWPKSHRPTDYDEVLACCVVLNDELNFTGHGDLGALGATKKRGVKLVDLYLEVGRQRGENINVSAGRGGFGLKKY